MSHGEKLFRPEETSLGKQEKMLYGEDLHAKCLKNKYCRSGIEMVLTLIIGQGVSNFAAYSKWLLNHGDIKAAGPYYNVTIGDKTERLHGQIKLNEYLRDHADEVKKYIDENGGFFLYRTEEPSADELDDDYVSSSSETISSGDDLSTNQSDSSSFDID